ncbi:MAG: hypothetical protein ACFCVD_14265 [Nodosilinea sp.]
MTDSCQRPVEIISPTATARLPPFTQNLSEYGFVLQNFWNNPNGHAVPDPFGLVK